MTGTFCGCTLLQIGCSVVVRDKSTIEVLHHYGVTCTYNELLRMKSSATHAAARRVEKIGLSQCDAGLIQVIAVNFDATISTSNGLGQSCNTTYSSSQR